MNIGSIDSKYVYQFKSSDDYVQGDDFNLIVKDSILIVVTKHSLGG